MGKAARGKRGPNGSKEPRSTFAQSLPDNTLQTGCCLLRGTCAMRLAQKRCLEPSPSDMTCLAGDLGFQTPFLGRLFGLALLSGAVLAVIMPGRASAAEPLEEPARTYAGSPNLYAAYEPDPDPVAFLAPKTVPVELRRFAPVAKWAHNHPYYCVSHHNSPGCGSLKAECAFLFGGCRLFYGEPCFKGPSPYAGEGHKRGCAGCAGP